MKRINPATILVLIILACGLGACASSSSSESKLERQLLVDKANDSAKRFAADPDMTWFREHLDDAQAILIVPNMFKAGYIIGGSGGSGVMMARQPELEWSYPAFYTMGSVTLGLQIGGEVSEVALVIMTKAGRDAMLTNEFKLGGDISVAAGPVGAGAKAQTADVLAFSRTKGGLYGGLNLEGAVITTREDWNRAYYGEEVRAVDILITGSARNPGADALRKTVADIDTTSD
jgi:SH3 domain-containing YSC84-like protein 1